MAGIAAARAGLDWFLRDRRGGGWTVMQPPNLALGTVAAATVAGWVAPSGGDAERVLTAGARLALLWWGLDELLRGVNPFRRALGGGALAALAARTLAG